MPEDLNPIEREQPDPQTNGSALSIRALTVGLLMAVWITLWPTYSSLILRSTRADHCHLSVAMLIPYVFLLVVNSRLEKWGWGFRPSEMLTVCCIGLVTACMQGEFLPVYLLEMISKPHYFASPENRFEELLLPNMPLWTTLTDRRIAQGFFEGVLPGSPFPWQHWLSPLFWWGALVLSILCVNLSLGVLLRKQWMEHERHAPVQKIDIISFNNFTSPAWEVSIRLSTCANGRYCSSWLKKKGRILSECAPSQLPSLPIFQRAGDCGISIMHWLIMSNGNALTSLRISYRFSP